MQQGRLILKGGQTLVSKDIDKKKKKKKKSKKEATLDASDAGEKQKADGGASDGNEMKLPAGTKPPSEYEAEFKLEMARAHEAKSRGTAWSVTYKAPPKVLHGYKEPVTGVTFEQRLDVRCARKSDRMWCDITDEI